MQLIFDTFRKTCALTVPITSKLSTKLCDYLVYKYANYIIDVGKNNGKNKNVFLCSFWGFIVCASHDA